MLLKHYSENHLLEAGCDEAGRGCLAGPVYAAAVILPDDFENELLNDSKKLTKNQRNTLRGIIEKEALSWAVASVDPQTIDKINILNASILAMHQAIAKLQPAPAFLLIDGNRFKKYESIPHVTIIKGDGLYLSIAAASVLAKTHRDAYMEQLHQAFPPYHWDKNKGYPTLQHKLAIQHFGLTPHHRKTFRSAIQTRLDF